jgi:RNA polymerase sigma-70 factor (ECF subfamily)
VCSFKTWLLHKTRWKIADQFRKRPPDCVQRFPPPTDSSHTAPLERVPDPESLQLDSVWEVEWEKNLLEAAMERVKGRIQPQHYQIFYLSVVRKLSPRNVAQALGVNTAQVYLVKHRVAGLVKKEVSALQRGGF